MEFTGGKLELDKYKFSKISNERLNTCHPDLQKLMRAVMADQEMDFSILCGHREKEAQNKAVAEGHSKLKWPKSRHNKTPSLAVDVAAYPINNFDKDNTERTKKLANIIRKKAIQLGVPAFWGGAWDHFPDIYHWQLPEYYRDGGDDESSS